MQHFPPLQQRDLPKIEDGKSAQGLNGIVDADRNLKS